MERKQIQHEMFQIELQEDGTCVNFWVQYVSVNLCVLYCHRKTGGNRKYLWEQIDNYSSLLIVSSVSLKYQLHRREK